MTTPPTWVILPPPPGTMIRMRGEAPSENQPVLAIACPPPDDRESTPMALTMTGWIAEGHIILSVPSREWIIE